jgi:ADP-ribose pyrophosphatase YjhB (NUDIX family)
VHTSTKNTVELASEKKKSKSEGKPTQKSDLFLLFYKMPINTTVRGILFITESNETKLVLMHRIKNGHEYYAFPGGKIEPGETQEETLHREIKEELNIDIAITDFFAEDANPEIPDLGYFYLCEHTGGEI